jgi:DnaJ-class molecular chaperone
MAGKNDAFDVLGLDNDASEREIKLAYLKLAKKFHPDMNKEDPNAHDKFLKVQNAYDSIVDKKEKSSKNIQERTRGRPSGSRDFRDFERIFSEFDSIFNSFFHDFKTTTQRKEPSHLDRPKTHVDLREYSRHKRTTKNENIFDGFDKEFSRLMKRIFKGF